MSKNGEIWDDVTLDESFVSGASHREGSAAERAQWARQAAKAARKSARQDDRRRRLQRRWSHLARLRPVFVVAGFLAVALVWSRISGGGGSQEPTVQAGATPTTAAPTDVKPTSIRVVYALPSDTVENPNAIPAIRHELGIVQRWFESQAGGRHLRLASNQEPTPVEIRHLSVTAAELRDRPDAYTLVDEELRPPTTGGTTPPSTEIFLTFVPVTFAEQVRCGTASGAGSAVVWVGSCGVSPSERSTRFGDGATFVMAHELVHALGAVDRCAPHYGRNGHVTDDPRDLMYDGPDRVDPSQVVLDPGHDDYFQTGRMMVCYDVASHPAWTA